MKLTKSLFVFACSAVLLVSCKDSGSAPKETANVAAVKKAAINPEKVETASFNIEGMTCAIGCAKTIQDELSATEGVQKANVDFDKKTATVEFDSSLQTPEKIVQIVEATADGKTYKVSNLKASKDHAMLLDQEKEIAKADAKKGKSDKKEGKKEGSCCAGKGKKHCSADEKKA